MTGGARLAARACTHPPARSKLAHKHNNDETTPTLQLNGPKGTLPRRSRKRRSRSSTSTPRTWSAAWPPTPATPSCASSWRRTPCTAPWCVSARPPARPPARPSASAPLCVLLLRALLLLRMGSAASIDDVVIVSTTATPSVPGCAWCRARLLTLLKCLGSVCFCFAWWWWWWSSSARGARPQRSSNQQSTTGERLLFINTNFCGVSSTVS